jgi:hypothetical protein
VKVFTCPETLENLEAFHDRELAVADEIAVSAHLEWCAECGEAWNVLRAVRATLRAAAPGRRPLSGEEYGGFTAALVSRLKAERDQSLIMRLRAMFDDMHLVYAGVGAAVATMICVISMLGMMRFATSERPDSLAAIVTILANPGSNANPVAIDARVQMPRALDGPLVDPASAQEDAVFALAAVVTREGTLANGTIADLQTLRSSGREGAAQAKAIEALMNAMSRARFEPAQIAGLPVAVNMVWLVAHTTVRGKRPIA